MSKKLDACLRARTGRFIAAGGMSTMMGARNITVRNITLQQFLLDS
jgi:hypothetical protein